MDTLAPTTVASHFTEIAGAIRAYIETAKSAAAGGITWQEFGELLISLLRLAVRLADMLDIPGAERKAIVLEAAAALFDAVADKAIPPYAWPLWILIRPSVRTLVLAIASGAIESLLPLTRQASPA